MRHVIELVRLFFERCVFSVATAITVYTAAGIAVAVTVVF
jgi:hypothetical protein